MIEAPRPLFSIVIPTYNRAPFIAKALETLRAQRFDDFEVVVVDDGSAEDVGTAIGKPAGLRVHFVRQANAGPSAARNTGRRHAAGRFLVFLDDDDVPEPEWLMRLADGVRAREREMGVMCCAVDLVDTESGSRELWKPTKLGPAHGSYCALALPGAYAMRAELFDLAGGFCEEIRYGEHHEMFLRALQVCTSKGWLVEHTTTPLIRKYHNRTLEIRERYSPAQVHSVEYHLRHHGHLMARDANMLSAYCALGGVAAVHLGQFDRARRFFLKGWLARPADPRNLARLLVSIFPPLARWMWVR